MVALMEPTMEMMLRLSRVLNFCEHLLKRMRMGARKEPGSQPTFTRDEFRNDPSKVMNAVKTAGRVIITESDGRPHLTIARQTEELVG